MKQDAKVEGGRAAAAVGVTATIGDGRAFRAKKGTRGSSSQERARQGKKARLDVPLARHAEWDPPADRTDPIELLEHQAETRIEELVPIRYGRMLVSPFSYYRGAALPMTEDLAATPTSGFEAQLCGDAHMSNFGVFGSPERHLFFDVNDFDETAPGPWEWDVKRLAASLEIAARENEVTKKMRTRIVQGAVRSYRETMRELAAVPMMSVWYAHLDVEEILPRFSSLLNRKRTPRVWNAINKARAHDSHQAFDKLCHVSGGETRIIHDPPLIVPVEEFVAGMDPEVAAEALAKIVRAYRRTLQPDRRHLLEQYELAHLARKVVGVGSVGTDAWIALFLAREDGAPLFLQIKEAQPSVLERFTTKTKFSNHGQRVVIGQRLVQAASDIFLGWERFAWGGAERDYYFRQLRDWKGSVEVDGMTPAGMDLWGRMCGWTLARAHARSGDRIAIAAYLGKSEAFDAAVAEFSAAYADTTERDYRALERAVADGRIKADIGI
ncbi:MAG: DUF2252 domain-containing protein [Acidimicrobiales bacterium]